MEEKVIENKQPPECKMVDDKGNSMKIVDGKFKISQTNDIKTPMKKWSGEEIPMKEDSEKVKEMKTMISKIQCLDKKGFTELQKQCGDFHKTKQIKIINDWKKDKDTYDNDMKVYEEQERKIDELLKTYPPKQSSQQQQTRKGKGKSNQPTKTPELKPKPSDPWIGLEDEKRYVVDNFNKLNDEEKKDVIHYVINIQQSPREDASYDEFGNETKQLIRVEYTMREKFNGCTKTVERVTKDGFLTETIKIPITIESPYGQVISKDNCVIVADLPRSEKETHTHVKLRINRESKQNQGHVIVEDLSSTAKCRRLMVKGTEVLFEPKSKPTDYMFYTEFMVKMLKMEKIPFDKERVDLIFSVVDAKFHDNKFRYLHFTGRAETYNPNDIHAWKTEIQMHDGPSFIVFVIEKQHLNTVSPRYAASQKQWLDAQEEELKKKIKEELIFTPYEFKKEEEKK